MNKSQQKQQSTDPQLLALSALLSLYERVRSVGLQELKFISVNEIKTLLDYTQAILVKKEDGKITLSAMSGVPEIDNNTPYSVFIKKLFSSLEKDGYVETGNITEIFKKDVSDKDIKPEWTEFLPDKLLWIGFSRSKYGVIYARKTDWNGRDIAIAEKIQKLLDQEFVQKSKADSSFIKKSWGQGAVRNKWKIILAVGVVLLFPFRTSVLAPAEIIPLSPSLVRAPLEGVIEMVHVKPNQLVKKNDRLFTYDKKLINSQIETSINGLKVAQAKLRQVSQEALNDPQARLKLSFLKGEVKKEKTNLEYTKLILKRAEVTAPDNGVVIFEDVFDWLGRPVSIGERVMLLAQKGNTQLEVRLPVHDSIELNDNADISFFSNAYPDKPVKATLTYYSYRASSSDLGEVSYKIKGSWGDDLNIDHVRLGLKGTAKLYGPRKPLVLQILRVPLMKVRQWLGM